MKIVFSNKLFSLDLHEMFCLEGTELLTEAYYGVKERVSKQKNENSIIPSFIYNF